MSRSYKYPYFCDYHRGVNGTTKYKRLASKKIRKTYDVDNFSHYKKHFCSYDIFDIKTKMYIKIKVANRGKRRFQYLQMSKDLNHWAQKSFRK